MQKLGKNFVFVVIVAVAQKKFVRIYTNKLFNLVNS